MFLQSYFGKGGYKCTIKIHRSQLLTHMAGLSVRNSGEVSVIEIQRSLREKKCLKKARFDIPDSVTFVPINFEKQSLKNALENAGSTLDQDTAFILARMGMLS